MNQDQNINPNDIAIIGMACRVSGAKNISEFWKNLIDGVESFSPISDDEIKSLGISDSMINDSAYIKSLPILPDVDKFDASFFGYTPGEAKVIDPQHRLFLECCWEAIENAGFSVDKFPGQIGIYAGSALSTYLINNLAPTIDLFGSPGGLQTLISNDKDYLASRIAYKLNLKGPAISVQTACSTSLVATHLACEALISHQCDVALAGGVCVILPQNKGYLFIEGSVLSRDGHCRAFDSKAEGTVFGNGLGVVALKRLSDAIKDNDDIYSVIKGTSVNNDGSDKVGYTAPSSIAQSKLISEALSVAGIDPSDISYIETHGTGTTLGDAIEIEGLKRAFGECDGKKGFCGIGSVKTNIGHLDAAAGIVGLIKTSLALKNKKIPASLNFENPNPQIDFVNSPFYVNNKLRDWDLNGKPLIAGVSSFGMGGTNAHIILEEFKERIKSTNNDSDKQLIVVSGKTESALKRNVKALIDHLSLDTNDELGNIAFTLQEGKKEFEWRQFVVADKKKKVCEKLEAVLGSGLNKGQASMNEKPHLVFMFPGQGAQYLNMGRSLYEKEKLFKEIIDQCAELVNAHLDLDIRELLFPKEANDQLAKKLERTVYTQPALFIIEYALARLLISYGIKPDSMIGHSVGDYVSACLNGVFNLEDALFILSRRAQLMQQQAPGSMLSVRLGEQEIKKYLNDDIALAAINSPNLLVLSGETEKINALSNILTESKIENRLLFTSHAYHSKMMEPAIRLFIEEFSHIRLNKPSGPFISSLTGTWIKDEQATDPSFWAKQLRNTVRFSDGIKELQKNNNLVLIELGPGRALSTMVSQHKNENVKQAVISTLTQPSEDEDDVDRFLQSIGKLWLAGIPISWKELHQNKSRKKVHLPTYQFEKETHWIDRSRNSQFINQNVKQASTQNNVRQSDKKRKVKKVIQESTMTRKGYISNLIKEILEELSGIKQADLDESKTFLELGFDSLFITQINLAFQKKFEVKITLRQLLETIPTISAIAEFIDNNLPKEKFEPPKQEIIVEEETEEIVEEYQEQFPSEQFISDSKPVSGNSSMEKLVFEQLEVMKKQLEIFGKMGSKNISEVPPQVQNKIMETTTPIKQQTETAVDGSSKKEKKVFERFGPYKPIDTKKDGSLTDQQQKYLNKLIAEYNKKTSTSKKMTQAHRAHYSDPRTVSGFLPIWKEMTYQVITDRSEGTRLWDVDGNEYIDVLMGFGQYLFGHNPKFIKDEIQKQLNKGFEIGPQSPIAGEVAKLICELTKMDRAAFCVTGSEAVLGAIRAARTVTGKDKVVFFTGDYHGIIDEVLVKTTITGDKIRTMPIAPGIPKENVQSTFTLEYGSEESLKVIQEHLHEIAAVMVEPIQARRPDIQPKEFLIKLRQITEDANIPLIFDEIITGFRVSPGGAQEFYGIKADMATYGKVIGGGFPIGVIAGKKLYMDAFDGGYWQYGDDSIPESGVTFFAGTFARHPISLTGAHTVLSYIKNNKGVLHQTLNKKSALLAEELNQFLIQRNVPIKILNFSSVLYYTFPKDLNYFSLLFYLLRLKGLHILEGFPFFLSEAHTDEDIRFIIKVFKESIIELQDNGFFPAPQGNDNFKKVEVVESTSGDKKKFPLVDAQREMWAGAQMSPDAAGPHHSNQGFYLNGPLNLSALKQAIFSVVEKHQALRCTISEDGMEAILNDGIIKEIPFVDLSDLPEKEKEKQLNEILRRGAKRIFDLNKGPLVEFKIIKLSAEQHFLNFSAQMIICDGWGNHVIFEDLASYYSAFVNNQEPKLKPAVSIREYSSLQKKHEGSVDQKQCEDYWLSQFKTIPDPLDLPTSNPRSPLHTYSGDQVRSRMSDELYQNIKVKAIELNTSYFAILLTAYYVWLHRLSNSNDIVVGVPFAAQSPLGMDRLVAQCANTLPIRIKIDKNESFSSLLKKIWSSVLDSQEYWNFTYGKLIPQLNIPFDSSRIPLVSTLFNLDPPMDKISFDGLTHRYVTGSRFYYQYDLGFNLVEDEESINIECDFNPDLFDRNIIREWVKSYTLILESIIKDAGFIVDRLPMKSNSSKLIQAEGTKSSQQISETNIVELFTSFAKKTPDSVSVISGNKSLNFKELDNQSDKIANYLLKNGTRQNKVTGICLNRTAELPVALLSVVKTGGAYILLESGESIEKIKDITESAKIDFVLTDDQTYKKLSGQIKELVNVNEILNNPGSSTSNLQDVKIKNDDLFCMIPKGKPNKQMFVEISYNGFINSLLSLKDGIGINQKDVLIHHSSFASGYEIFEIFLPLFVGAKSVIVSEQVTVESKNFIDMVIQQKVTHLLSTPSVWKALLDTGLNGTKNLIALSSGEFLSRDLAAKLENNFKEVWNLYGTPESGIFSTIAKVSSKNHSLIGNPILNSQILLVDENLEPVPVGVPGEILVKGDSFARGDNKNSLTISDKYVNLTFNGKGAERFFRTGDLARYNFEGKIEFLCRKTERIKVRNYNFDPHLIESVIIEDQSIKDVIVSQKNIPEGLKKYIAYLVPSGNTKEIQSQQKPVLIKNLRKKLRSKLPESMLPESFVVLEKIPIDINDKINFDELPLPEKNEIQFEDFIAPGNKTEEKLLSIWQELLNVSKISVKDNFFELGGKSLLAVKLFNRIEEEFGQRFPLAMLFKASTIQDLANKLINKEDNNFEWPSLIPIQTKGSKRPLFLVHGAGGNVLLYNALAKQLEPDYPLYGLQSQGLDGNSKPLHTIEEMAEKYLQEIIAVQPKGPYLLGGYCLGGTVAYEMAQRLRLRGEEVAMVAMMDTYNMQKMLKVNITTYMTQKIRFHLANAVKLKPKDLWEYIKEKKRIYDDGGWRVDSHDQDGVSRAESGFEASVQTLNDKAMEDYIPKPYEGVLTLVKPKINYKFYPDPKMGWSDLAVGGLDIIDLPINPHAMLVNPFVEIFAKELKSRLDRLEGISNTANFIEEDNFNLESIQLTTK